jgi:hypothetical protein
MSQMIAAAAVAALLFPALGAGTHPARDDARRGPPWISVEYPVNPHDPTTRGAFLVVNAYHHGTPTAFPVRGTAEGIVAGQRRTVSLEFTRTSRPGVYALRNQWRDEGTWTLVLAVVQGEGDGNTAQALVEIGADGTVASVKVPSRRSADGWTIPSPVAMADVERALQQRTRVEERAGAAK